MVLFVQVKPRGRDFGSWSVFTVVSLLFVRVLWLWCSCSELDIQISVGIAPRSEGGEKVTGSGRTPCQAHHAWRAPHFDSGVVTGGQQELLVGGAEGNRVHHVVVAQASQTDVVMAVPNVPVLVFSTTAEMNRKKKRVSTKYRLTSDIFYYVGDVSPIHIQVW